MQRQTAHSPARAGGWWLALGWLLACFASGVHAAENEGAILLEAPADSGLIGDKLIPFDVTVNGVNTGTWLFLERANVLYATEDAFENWRIAPDPDVAPISYRGQVFHSVNDIPGFTRTVDLNNQSLLLEFAPEVFAETRLARRAAQIPDPSPVLTSLFLNYDFNYSMSRQADGVSPDDLSTLSELGFSTGLGVLTTSVIGNNLTNYQRPEMDFRKEIDQKTGRSFNRLETTFTRDFPKRKLTLRMGDAYTKPGMLGRGVYFGGVSIGTNFGLHPSFIRQPLSPVTGLSASPSTVELYVNDVLRQVSSVPAGPFAIDNFPTLSGNGTARIVVRDQLGRETVVEQSFMTNSDLLAKGVNDWSLAAGKVRNELGTADSTYGDQFYSGFLRRGVRDTVTLEGRMEVLPSLSNVSVGVVSALPLRLLGRAAVSSSSHDVLGRGQQALMGIEYRGQVGNAVVEVQTATENYRQLGQGDLVLPVRRQVVGSWSYGSATHGSFMVGLARLERYSGDFVKTMSASYTRRIGRTSSVSVVASRAQNEMGATSTISLNLVVPLGKNRSLNSYVSAGTRQRDVNQSWSQNVGPGSNVGWRMMVGRMTNRNRIEAGINYMGRYGNVGADIGHTAGNSSLRLGTKSSIVVADGAVFATRNVDHGFAVVEIEGFKGVGVGLGSNVMAYTNKRGKALIPRLASYQNNAVQLDPRDLPITAGIDSIEKIVVPSYRSAVKVSFPVRTGRGALVQVVLDDGQPAPLGALVNIDGESETFFVARRGEAFVTGLKDTTPMTLNFRGQSCRFEVRLPPEQPEEIPRVGPFLCPGVLRH